MKNRELLARLLESCNSAISLAQLHTQLLKNGLSHDSFIVTKLVSLLGKFSSLNNARKVFEEMPHRSVYLWNAMLRCHCRENRWEETLLMFNQMMGRFDEKPDNFTVPIAIKACAGLLAVEAGKVLHGYVEKNGEMGLDMFVGAALIELYSKCGEMGDALRVFQRFPKPDVVLWTSMVTGYQQNGNAVDALSFFLLMMSGGDVSPDPVTLVSVVAVCGKLEILNAGRCVHGLVVRKGFDYDLALVNSLLNFYAKMGFVGYAQNLFRGMVKKDVISWSCMMACCVKNEMAGEALDLFSEIVEKRLEFNSVTLISALQACAAAGDIGRGRRIHELARRNGCELDVLVSNSLIDMYMKCSCIDEAIGIFQRMPKKDVVLWVTLMSGYTLNGLAIKSLEIFRVMLANGTRPDAVAVVKLLDACSQLGSLHQGLCIHGCLIHGGFHDKAFVVAALIDLYSKCGSLDLSIRVFEGLSERDVVVWSSMIAAYGIHGFCKEAIQTFSLMTENSLIKPNHVTFLSVLSACGHTGMVEDGINIFNKMRQDYCIEPNSDHYSVMVDLMGRTGQLDEAMKFINQMPIPPGPHVWGALLGACRIHQNIEMGEKVAEKLLQLDPGHTGYYMLLSSIYAVDGKWDNALKVKNLVKDKGLKKIAGLSEYVCHGEHKM
ncbi:hypothetical protein Sjap_014703 [Stephania japonica]|uniref:Pentatricopeptide repeat-containing protein n=1 Tax=Stephania japonica TaxID=461633 RepID=A0AAP0IJA4_9MAGN